MNLRDLFKSTPNARDYPSGTMIFSEGESGDEMFVVIDGEVEIQVGASKSIIMKAGDVFGEMALIDASPRSGHATARTDCRLAPIDEKRFLYMVQQTPYFALQLLRTLTHRLRCMNQT